MKKKYIIFWIVLIMHTSKLLSAQNAVYKFEIDTIPVLTEIIRDSILIPKKSYNKLVRSEQNNYILFNSLNTNALLLKADIVKENFSIEANRFSKSVPKLAYGAKIQTDYSNSSKNEAAIYANDRFVNNLKFEGNIKYFLDVSDKFGDKRDDRIDYLNKKLNNLQELWKKKVRVLEIIKDLNKRLNSGTLGPDSTVIVKKELYFWNEFSLTKTFGEEEEKALKKDLEKRVEVLYSETPYQSRNFTWLNVGLQHYKNEFATFDESGKTVKDKFSKKSFSNWEVNLSFNKLIVKENLTYWSAGISYVETSNIDELSTKTYIQTVPVINTNDTLTTRKEVKAYIHNKLDYQDNFRVRLNYVQGLNAIWKTGFDERFSFDFKGNAWNHLGYFFPVYNAKDKVATVIQVYWATNGKLYNFRELSNWDSEIGLAIGLPINLDSALNK